MTDKRKLDEIDQSIPALKLNRQQRAYYPVNFRRCVKMLWVMLILNLAILLLILYFFFTSPDEVQYATSFSGEITQLTPNSNAAVALAITRQHQNDT